MWKKRTNSTKLSSDFNTWATVCTNTLIINNINIKRKESAIYKNMGKYKRHCAKGDNPETKKYCGVLISFCCCNKVLWTKSSLWEKALYFSLQFQATVCHSREGTVGRTWSGWLHHIYSQDQRGTNECNPNCSRLPFAILILLITHCLGNNTAHTGLDIPISINNQDSPSQACLCHAHNLIQIIPY